jgi:hypothetical protein
VRNGSPADFALYKKANVTDLKKLSEPDAVFRQGQWAKPINVP